MRQAVGTMVLMMIAGSLALAQQTPPADGVGIGNSHLTGNASVSDVPSMSPNQNQIMTSSDGSTSGDKGIPAFAGSGGAETATAVNGQGTMGVRQSTAANFVRRVASGMPNTGQNRAMVVQNGNQVNPTLGSKAGQGGNAQQNTSGTQTAKPARQTTD